MKLLASSILFATTMADFSQIMSDANSQVGQLAIGERALLKTDMQLISEYGCWCYFEGDHGAGRSHPVDEIDTYCKTLHDGYTCIIMDSEAKGEPCTPWEIPYNSAVSTGVVTGMTMENLIFECDAQNSADTCASWTCRVEGWFVVQWMLYSLGGGGINQANRHANGFDKETECPISVGIKSEKACCGEYPLRFPYKTYNGARDCCQNHTFNTNLYVCCADGHARINC